MDTEQVKVTNQLWKKVNLGQTYSKSKLYIPAISATIILLIAGQLMSPGFAGLQNIGNLLALAAVLSFAASGQTLIVLSGREGIDLSVGAMMSMGALMGAMLSGGHTGSLLSVGVTLAVIGAVIGAVNAVGIQFLRIPPLVMTMGMATVVNGLVLAYTKGQPSGSVPPILSEVGAGTWFGPIRWLFLVGLLLVIAIELVLRKTMYGKKLYMIGSNRRAAFFAGVDVNRSVFITYCLAGALGSVGGLILLSNVGSAQMGMGLQYTLLSVAAVVIGGTKMSGGSGTFIGSALGALFLVVLTSVLLAMQMAEGVRLIIQGLILVVILVIYSKEPKLRQ